MKTLNDLKEQLAKDSGYASWQGYKDCWRGVMPDKAIEVIAKSYASEVLKELLKRKHEANAKYAFQKGSWESIDNIALMLITELK